MKHAVYSVIAALAVLAPLSAQETSHFAFQVGAGFTEPVGRTGFYTDVGYNTAAGFGYNFNSNVGALIDLNVTSVGVTSATLKNIGLNGGNLNVLSATFDPIVHLLPHSKVDVYFTGGGGEYRREQIFVAPLFGGVNHGASYFGIAPSSTPFGTSSSVNKPGVDAGVGIAMGSKWHGKYFAEMKYNKIFLGGRYHTDYENITFGYRW